MVVPVALNLIITPVVITATVVAVVISMLVCLHDVMLIRAPIVRSILSAREDRGQCGDRKSR